MKPVIRCSSLDTVLLCHGSLTLASIVDPRAGEEGMEGTEIHAIAHNRMTRELGAGGDFVPIAASSKTKFSRWIADFYYRFVSETTPAGWALETEAALAYEFDRFDLSGHIDCFAISPDATEAIGFDLKTGYIPVEPADNNEQVFGYACLLLRAYPTLRKITFYIVQPRNDEDEGFPRISPPMVMDGELLGHALAVLEQRVNAALDNPLEVNSGRVQCRWCPAAMQCPATIGERELMKIKLTPEQVAAIKRTPEDKTLADWLISAKTLAQPIEDARELASERIKANGSITATDGTTITQKIGKGAYKVLNAIGLWATLVELLSEERRIRCMKFSMTSIKDEIAEELNVPKTGKAAVTAESVFDAKIRTHVEQGERRTFQFL